MSKGMNNAILIFCIALILYCLIGAISFARYGYFWDAKLTYTAKFIEREKGASIEDFMAEVMEFAETKPNVWAIKGKLGLFGTGKAEMIMPANIQWLPNEFGEVSAAIVWWWEREAGMEKR